MAREDIDMGLGPRNVVKRTAAAISVALVLLSIGPVSGQDPALSDLKNASPGHQVVSVRFCRGEYDVALGDGTSRRFREFDLAFKTDDTERGPQPTKPVLVPTGRMGDRAFVVFAGLAELRATVQAQCRE